MILVREIRVQETLSTALEAAQIGHLVFGTLHTNSAVKTVEPVLGMYAPEEKPSIRRSLCESLVGVIAQGLIRTNNDKRASYHDILVDTDACRDTSSEAPLMRSKKLCRAAASAAWLSQSITSSAC